MNPEAIYRKSLFAGDIVDKFETFTDPDLMKGILQQQLQGLRWRGLVINKCVVERAHYKHVLAQRSRAKSVVSIHYLLDVTDGDTGRAGNSDTLCKSLSWWP